MADAKLIEVLGGWEGYVLGTIGRMATDSDREDVLIELQPRRDQPRRCSGCGQMTTAIHDTTERWVRELPLLDADTWLLVHRVRVACPTCGPKLEDLSWLAPFARLTRRLEDSVARLCQVLPIRHVAEWFRLDWKTVKAIDKAYLERTLGPVDLRGVEQIVMDEFALQKGHRYATVVVEPSTKRVLWVGRGRAREEVRPFFEQLGPDGRQRLKAVAMDMNGAYEAEVKSQCPQARIVYDRFHVVAKYGHEVIDAVRTAEAKRCTARGERQVIKGARWLLLRNGVNLKRQDRVRLRELLATNRRLATVYVLKDDLKALWDYRLPSYALQFWREWKSRALQSAIAPLKRFTRRLADKLAGLLAHCEFPLHTSLLEGINNKIKVIKRMAYGFRDDAYFFLKIRAAFPGNRR
ncbi:MAG TPA: ISL3 family transposase [Pseudolabrys sp.]